MHARGATIDNARVREGAAQPVIGVDVGGTKVAAARVADARAFDVVEQPTDLRGPDAIMAEIEAAVRQVADACGEPRAVGIGLPSQIEYATGRVISSVNIPLEGVALREELTARLGTPVFVDNDANCAALAEAHAVDGKPLRHLVMYTLGTGVGGGVVIDGRIFHGASGLGAELGHVVIDEEGPECPGSCPNRGCLEAFCSGTALARDALEVAKTHKDSALGRQLEATGKVTAVDAVGLAREGDPQALRLFDRFARHLGAGISNAVNVFEPEQIVIGGGLSAAAELFLDAAREEAASRALPALFERVTIECAKAGAQAGVIGAGLLANQETNRNLDTASPTAREGVR